jgi:hypothetical protein
VLQFLLASSLGRLLFLEVVMRRCLTFALAVDESIGSVAMRQKSTMERELPLEQTQRDGRPMLTEILTYVIPEASVTDDETDQRRSRRRVLEAV